MLRAKKGFTFDPCHGCGQVPSDWQGRPKDKVCSNCANTLQLARKFTDEQAAIGDVVQVAIPTQPHWFPYIPHSNIRRQQMGTQETIWQLALSCSSPSIENTGVAGVPRLIPVPSNGRTDWSPHKQEDVRLMPASIAAQFAMLYTVISRELTESYEDGKERGQSLLGQLASGEITASKFNEMSITGK